MLATRAVPAGAHLARSLKTKKGHLAATLFCFGGGGGSLSLRYRSTDLRFAPATRAVSARVQSFTSSIKRKKGSLSRLPFPRLVVLWDAGLVPTIGTELVPQLL